MGQRKPRFGVQQTARGRSSNLLINLYFYSRILDDEEKEWMKIEQHLLLPSLQGGTPTPNSCTYVPGGGGRPCRSTISEKNYAGHVMAPPPPPPPLPTPPPPPSLVTNAYPSQMIQFGVAAEDRK
ncbi:Hypothetical predicted protein [Olea europaea subsp. europaea]|uniref:Uncharacterized protein n=1 Tax=Olea europaea subsp. europaea TaxID=158383 RepID=A0A8S0PXP0_OLEEU|nr:Hypothetical predicted protein [Olea europaea subsp. europaea]